MIEPSVEKAICLSCATVFESDFQADLACPNCRRVFPRLRYNQLVHTAAVAVRFGHQYRGRYRANALAGDRHALEPLDVIFAWIALAVIGGIVENVSWEITKKIIKKILVSNFRLTGESHLEVVGLIEDSAKLERFAADVLAFHQGKRIDADVIEGALEEEYVVSLMMNLIEHNGEVVNALSSAGLEQRELLMASLIGKLREVRAQEIPLTEKEVEDLWKYVELSA